MITVSILAFEPSKILRPSLFFFDSLDHLCSELSSMFLRRRDFLQDVIVLLTVQQDP